MTFHERDALDRYGEHAMAGDLAENKVMEVLARMDRPCQPFGPRRTPTERAQQTTWPPEVRHMPDFLGWGRFIEVQGSDGYTVIFKQNKLDALAWWEGSMPVFFAIYLLAQDQVLFCDMPTVRWAIAHPDTEELILDPDTANPKMSWRVPISVLMERLTVDAFAASKAAKGRNS